MRVGTGNWELPFKQRLGESKLTVTDVIHATASFS